MDYTKLSKEISYALRHAPWEYELELDEEGFVQRKTISFISSKHLKRNVMN